MDRNTAPGKEPKLTDVEDTDSDKENGNMADL